MLIYVYMYTYYKHTLLFRADVREITHGLIICTIRYMYFGALGACWSPLASSTGFTCEFLLVLRPESTQIRFYTLSGMRMRR